MHLLKTVLIIIYLEHQFGQYSHFKNKNAHQMEIDLYSVCG